ncbi:hypothetical protein [uncultured Helicobacter sp.]|uniref:hypothetical protein n=1 Tax=uncultured Helicobacter sp. TaxID=175537 RepID=UPI0026080C3E|nr:hypothetical protein [uncultured Helicobacter sp.]
MGGFFCTKKTTNNTTNLYNTTSYGAVTGSNLSNLFGGGNTFSIGSSGSIYNEANGGFGGGSTTTSPHNTATNSNTTTQKDELGFSASVGLGIGGGSGSAGSASTGLSGSDSYGGGLSQGGGLSSPLIPLALIGMLGVLMLNKRK